MSKVSDLQTRSLLTGSTQKSRSVRVSVGGGDDGQVGDVPCLVWTLGNPGRSSNKGESYLSHSPQTKLMKFNTSKISDS